MGSGKKMRVFYCLYSHRPSLYYRIIRGQLLRDFRWSASCQRILRAVVPDIGLYKKRSIFCAGIFCTRRFSCGQRVQAYPENIAVRICRQFYADAYGSADTASFQDAAS